MKIELKRLSVYARMSEETIAFSADLWVDGVKAGTAENNGKGGSNMLRVPRSIEKAIEDYCKTLPPLKWSQGDLPMDGDLFITCLVEREELRKKLVGRALFKSADGKLLQTKKLPAEKLALVKPRPGETLLSIDEALDLALAVG